MDYKVVGTSPVRPDAIEKVNGRAVFGPDVMLPGLLHAWMLRSPYAHARIISIDTSKAREYPGVHAVVTHDDLAEVVGDDKPSRQTQYHRDRTLARGKVLFDGHAVAAVAAVTRQVAEEASKLIKVEYEVLEPVLSIEEAIKEDAIRIHEDLKMRSLGPENGKPGNIARHIKHVLGDPEKGFKEADTIVERRYKTAMVHQGYLEPQTATAKWGSDGDLTIWSSTQGSFKMVDQVTEILNHAFAKIKVIPTEVGGAFGGKTMTHIESVVSLLSWRSGRPVKMVMTQSDVLRASGPAPGIVIDVKIGAKKTGRITAATTRFWLEAGGFPGAPVGQATSCVLAGYDIPNGSIDAYDVVINKPYISDYRAPGVPQVHFGVEQAMDEMAEKLGLDPIRFRLMNAPEEGGKTVNGATHLRIGAKEVLRATLEHPHYNTPVKEPNTGRGVAMGFWMNWGSHSSCTMSVNSDGSVTLLSGSVDLSGTRTTCAMMAAEVLGIPVEKVRSNVGDTDSVGYCQPTGGSRTTFATGRATVLAAEHVLDQMTERAAFIWDTDADNVEFSDGAFHNKIDDSEMSFAELASQLNSTGGPVTGKGNIDAQGWGSGFGTNIADVHVDPETGKVKVLRYTVIQDVGKAIHPTIVEGQLQGGTVQGIGWALWEGYQYDDKGKLMNPNRLDNKLPTFMDVPRIETVLIEVPGPNHPFGVRGVGENPIVPPPACIANAVKDATGVRFTELPLTPERILRETGVI